MSFNICSLSGMHAEEAVVSTKSGHVFEKRLIYKHIEATGRCPITKQELTKEDLIEVKSENSENKINRPRNINTTSMPGMLTNLQGEWDNLLLETFTLKKELDVARQELAHSLYQSDASTRVISNLLKERDTVREEILNYKAEYADVEYDEDAKFIGDEFNFMGISQDLINKITEMSYKLIGERKVRKIPEDLKSFDQIKSFKIKSSLFPFDGVKTSEIINNPIGVTCADLKNNSIIFGGTEGSVALCEISENLEFENSTLKIHKIHKRKINDIQFYPGNEVFGFASCSDDGTAAFCFKSSLNESLEERYRIGNNIHTDVITGVSFHPLNEYALVSSFDGCWSFHNLMKGVVLHREFNGNELTTVRFHPDGGIFATAQKTGLIKLWDISSQQEFAKLHEGGMESTTHISFSENGFYLASCGEEDKVVRIWDIRKNKVVKSVELAEDVYVNKVEFDKSGSYLGLAGNGVEVYNVKNEELHKFETHKGEGLHKNICTGIKFENNSDKFVISASLDGDVKLLTQL